MHIRFFCDSNYSRPIANPLAYVFISAQRIYFRVAAPSFGARAHFPRVREHGRDRRATNKMINVC
jgi:hypothetical protein